mgnify:FL=1
MSTVADILKSKSNSAVVSVRPEHSVFEALRLMAEKGIGAVLVMAGKDVQGIFTERDYARKLVLQGRASNQTLVRDVMTCNVLCVRPTQTTEECMAIMTDKRIRHLPMADNGRVIGMVSIGDVVRSTLAEQQIAIDSLTQYVMGCSTMGCR